MSLLIGFLLYSVLIKSSSESLVNKPTSEEKQKFANIILENASIFKNGTLDKAKSIMDWMDAILYEDLRKLAYENQLNVNNVMNVLS